MTVNQPVKVSRSPQNAGRKLLPGLRHVERVKRSVSSSSEAVTYVGELRACPIHLIPIIFTIRPKRQTVKICHSQIQITGSASSNTSGKLRDMEHSNM
ncbi:hypothetical protein DPEC_G00300390 [Dallia pectoralis]|uniref:Uncharacterized protein n=1 Tax=Dallia pectoralis TaxID=75939 RepID=A0ACC2FGE8_DALPE|nr:hypothetical protein DPEC_G00300390 [Dallia pectoralis]